MLQIKDVSVSYGGIRAISEVTMHVPEGSVVAIIGANGAGKSTLLKAISGLVTPQQGRIVYNDRDLVGMAAHRIVGLGLAQVPEGRQLFAHLTVKDNIRLGAFTRVFKRGERNRIDADYQRVLDLFPMLAHRSGQIAGTLSGGEQQMLAIGRSLMTSPKLLLLDEPSMGLAPLVVNEIMAAITALNADGVTIVLVEQNARSALAIAHHAYVLETGACVLDGSGTALMEDPKVQAAYLGGRAH